MAKSETTENVPAIYYNITHYSNNVNDELKMNIKCSCSSNIPTIIPLNKFNS